MKKITKQRLIGVALVAICVLILIVAASGATPEERDITPVVLLLPLGIYTTTTKKDILHLDGKYRKEPDYGKNTHC